MRSPRRITVLAAVITTVFFLQIRMGRISGTAGQTRHPAVTFACIPHGAIVATSVSGLLALLTFITVLIRRALARFL